MKNGHAETEKAVIDDVLDTEVGRPTRVQDFNWCPGSKNNNKKAAKYFKAISWDEWWDEFSTATNKNGALKYRTARQFAVAKASSNWERDIIWECIAPVRPEGKQVRVPWLGDWQKRRENGFWALDDPGKILSIKQAIRERQDALDSAKAAAPLTIPKMQRWYRLSLRIDEAFGGEPFDKDLSPLHPKNKQRVREYIALHKAADAQLYKAIEVWQRSNGLDPNDAQAWIAMAGMVAGRAGAAGAIAGMTVGSQLPNGQTIEALDLMLMKDLRDKAQEYPGISLPDVGGLPAGRKQ